MNKKYTDMRQFVRKFRELEGIVEDMERTIAEAELVPVLESRIQTLLDRFDVDLVDNGDGAIEVVKRPERIPEGDYLNPIRWVQGMEVTLGQWYYDADPELPAECAQGGIAETFGAPWLDVVSM